MNAYHADTPYAAGEYIGLRLWSFAQARATGELGKAMRMLIPGIYKIKGVDNVFTGEMCRQYCVVKQVCEGSACPVGQATMLDKVEFGCGHNGHQEQSPFQAEPTWDVATLAAKIVSAPLDQEQVFLLGSFRQRGGGNDPSRRGHFGSRFPWPATFTVAVLVQSHILVLRGTRHWRLISLLLSLFVVQFTAGR